MVEKHKLIRAMLKILEGSSPDAQEANVLEAEVKRFCAGRKRWGVHSSGFKFADADLLMLWEMSRSVQRVGELKWFSYAVARAFCCDYRNMRFTPDQYSAVRVRLIATHLSTELRIVT